MGIQGLLPLLKSIQATVHLSDLSGKTLAVDGYVWLHKGAYGCASEMVNDKPTTKYVEYAMHRVRLLRHHGVEPYIVFDGGPLPAKQGTEVERKKKRSEALAKAKHLSSIGRHSEARDLYVKCVDIRPEHVFQLIKALKAEGVQYIVAPYEADPQLLYLELHGIVNGILTEDSDLLVFGARNLYCKLDPVTATVTHIDRSTFAKCKDINLTLWGEKEFRHMAMLSGCDYLEGLKGVGVRTANKLLRKWKTLEGVIKHVALDMNVRVPKGYLEQVKKAELAFLWQRVFCPAAKTLVHLRGDPEEEWSDDKDAYVGKQLEDDLALSISLGETCPITHLPIMDINPRYQPRSKHTLVSSTTSAAKPPPTLSGPMDRFLAAKSKSPKKQGLGLKKVIVKGSGFRTLVGEQEKIQSTKAIKTVKVIATSRFFASTSESTRIQDPVLGESRLKRSGKTSLVDAEESVILDGTEPVDAEDIDESPDAEEAPKEEEIPQEDGYRSPSPSFVDVIRASSPVHLESPETQRKPKGEDEWEDEVLSSPMKPTQHRALKPTLTPRAVKAQLKAGAKKAIERRLGGGIKKGKEKAWRSETRKKMGLMEMFEFHSVKEKKKEIISLVSPSPSPRRSRSRSPSKRHASRPLDDPLSDLTLSRSKPTTISKVKEHVGEIGDFSLAPDLSGFFESFDTASGSSQGKSSGLGSSMPSSEGVEESPLRPSSKARMSSPQQGLPPRRGAQVHPVFPNRKLLGERTEGLTSPIKSSQGVPESDFDAVAESDYEDKSVDVDLDQKRVETIAKGWRERYSLGSRTSAFGMVRRDAIISKRPRSLSPSKSPRRSTTPLQPTETNLGTSATSKFTFAVSGLPLQATKAQHNITAKAQQVAPRRSFSSVQRSDDTDERAFKRRRVSMPMAQQETFGNEDVDVLKLAERRKAKMEAFAFGR